MSDTGHEGTSGQRDDPARVVVEVKDQDFRLLAFFGIVGFVVLVLFFSFLRWGTTLLSFPQIDTTQSMTDYYLDALIYRERRMVLALTLRTFITGLSFIVGLALCTQGGIFILRQVMAATKLSGNWGGSGVAGSEGDDTLTGKAVRRLGEAQFAFSSYSPGVVFLLGGVTIMALTLWLTVPVRGVEVVPPGALTFCQLEEGGDFQVCEVETVERGRGAPEGGAAATSGVQGVSTETGVAPLPPQ